MSIALLVLALQDTQPVDLSADLDVPDGLAVTLWAESPQLFNPTAIDVDERGRVWVTEGVNYRRFNRNPQDVERPNGDRVVVLEDTDLDGRCDSSRVFVEDPELVSPLGIAVIGERVFVSCSPSILVYQDRNADDDAMDAGEKETFLTGFGGRDHDHGVHSIVFGPNGRFYFAVGNAGPHIVTDKNGWTLRSGSIYNGGGATSADNKPGLVSDDGRVYTGGLILSVKPDGTDLQVEAHNFRNEYEVALDSYGNMFTFDNDDEVVACRASWVMEGGNYGFFASDGSRDWRADQRPRQPIPIAQWHAEDPGVVRNGFITGSGGPTGCCLYEGELLARWFDGQFLAADAGRGTIFAFSPVVDGAEIRLDPKPALISARASRDTQGARWFRPSDVCVNVDGAIYVADWYDPGVGGHAAGDRACYGRILRIAPPQSRPAVVEELSQVAGLDPWARLPLYSPAVNVRSSAWGERASQFGAHGPWLLFDLDGVKPARLLWWYLLRLPLELASDPEPVGPKVRELTERMLTKAGGIRRIVSLRARRILGEDLFVDAALVRQNPSVSLGRELLLALRDESFDDCDDLLRELARGFDGKDRVYLEALGIACEGKEEEVYALLAAELGEVPAKWDARFAAIAWRLHPPSTVPAFLARAMDGRLATDARKQSIDAIAFVRTQAAAEAMANIALAGPEDLRAYAQWWLENRATNDWRAFVDASALGGGLESAELVWTSGIVRTGLHEVDIDVRGAKTLWLVVSEGENGNSYDWADWLAPRFEGASGARKLVDLTWRSAAQGWGSSNVGKSAEGGPLVVEGKTYADGIGTHARSEIAYGIPAGAERFRAIAAPDDMGSKRAGSNNELEFQVYLERGPSREAFAELRDRAVSATADSKSRLDALRELALDPEGGLVCIELAEGGAIDAAQRAAIAERIFDNPDLGVRALASAHFERPGGGTQFPPIAELVKREGSAARGRKLFLEPRAQCSTCHAYDLGGRRRGGDIGPELSGVRTKLDAAALFDAILNPSASIAMGFDTWRVEDTSGRLYSGFVIADGEMLVLKDTQGKRHAIPSEEVADRSKEKISTMPSGVASELSAEELVDLVAFLREDPAREPEFGPPIELFNGKDLQGWTHHLSDASAKRSDVWSIVDGTIVCRGNPAGYIRTEADFENFELTLEWRFDPVKGPGNSGVLLRMTGPDQVWPRSIEGQLMHTNAGDIWNIGDVPMAVDVERTEGRHTTRRNPTSEKPLGEWNRYRIRLDRGDLVLEVNRVVQNRASWCEEIPGKICLQSEGAEIHFRNVVLRPILN